MVPQQNLSKTVGKTSGRDQPEEVQEEVARDQEGEEVVAPQEEEEVHQLSNNILSFHPRQLIPSLIPYQTLTTLNMQLLPLITLSRFPRSNPFRLQYLSLLSQINRIRISTISSQVSMQN